MYLTVCPLCGPDHDSSVGELMYLTVSLGREWGWREGEGQGEGLVYFRAGIRRRSFDAAGTKCD